MSKSRLFFGGEPTGPEVKKLESAFPDIKSIRGTTILHTTISEILNIPVKSNRYRTVTNVWRRRVERDSGVVIRGDLSEVVNVGFRVLSDSEQLQFSGKEFKAAGHKIVRGHYSAANTDEANLSDAEKRIREHRMIAGKMLHTAFVESRKFLPTEPAPPEVQPKRT